MAVRKGYHHVAMNVMDFEGTIRFYKEALGCELVRVWPAENPSGAMLDVGGSILEIFKKEKNVQDDLIVYPHIALVSEDVDADYKRALEFGAKPHTEPKDIAIPSEPALNARIAFFEGINGEVVELFQEK